MKKPDGLGEHLSNVSNFAAASLLLSTLVVGQPRYTVVDLGTMNGASTVATGINANGVAVGTSSGTGLPLHGFIQAGGLVDLGTLGGTNTHATWINNSDQVVGYSALANGQFHAFRYLAGTMTDLGTLDGIASEAYQINNGGQIVGYSTVTNTFFQTFPHAFLYSGGTMMDLGTLGGQQSYAFGINDSGQIVGESQVSTTNPYPHAFLFSNGQMNDLGTLGGTWSCANSINNIGQIVGFSWLPGNSSYDAFLYSNGSMKDLGTLSSEGGTNSQALALNDSGQVVGGIFMTNGQARAFYYSNGTMYDLNNLVTGGSALELFEASAINNSGYIAAAGTIGPQTHACILIPNASAVGLLQVTINPSGAVNAGAQWQVDGGAWQRSGATVTNLSAGNHSLSFSAISGWETPASQVVTVNTNQTTTAAGVYAVEAIPPFVSGCAVFSHPTDTILINGHTVVTNQITIEAEILICSSLPAPTYSYARIFEEQLSSHGDKQLWASLGNVGGSTWVADNQGTAIGVTNPGANDVWHHLAFVHDFDENRVYLDGVEIGTLDFSGDPSIACSPGTVMSIGAFLYTGGGALAQSFIGAIQWLRVSCVARYSGASVTPPVTVPPSDAFTQILFDFTHVAPGTSTVYDLSPNHFTGTVAAGFSGATAPSFVLPAGPMFQTVTQANNALTLTWSTVAGQIYQLQYKTNLAQPNWINWFYPLVATGESMTVSDSTCGSAQRFYQVVQLP